MVYIHNLNKMAWELYRDQDFGCYKTYHVRASIHSFKLDIDDVIYGGCPLNHCKKKLQPDGGLWYCEKCDDYYPDFQYRYKLKAYLDDGTMRPFLVTMFENTAKPFLGISAPDLAEVHDYDHDEYYSFFNDAENLTGQFRLRVALVQYGDRYNPSVRLNGIVADYDLDDL